MKKLIAGIAMLASALASADTMVEMKTNLGSMTIELNDEAAPITVENFLKYVDDGFYEGLIVHRVIPGFMMQTGGFNQDLSAKETTYPAIENESLNGLLNERGTLSMARTGDPNSATTQFFINFVHNRNLDGAERRPGYAVFGKVVDGLDVLDQVERAETRVSRQLFNFPVPVEPIIIESITRIELSE